MVLMELVIKLNYDLYDLKNMAIIFSHCISIKTENAKLKMRI